MRLRSHYATADYDSPRRRREHEGVQQLPKRMRHGAPRQMVGLNLVSTHPDTGLDGRPAREALDARAVKHASARPLVARHARDAKVPHLRVITAEHGRPIY